MFTDNDVLQALETGALPHVSTNMVSQDGAVITIGETKIWKDKRCEAKEKGYRISNPAPAVATLSSNPKCYTLVEALNKVLRSYGYGVLTSKRISKILSSEKHGASYG